MQLDLILRGQSNAAYLAELDGFAGAGRLVTEVERLLGFDGVNDRVTLVYDRDAQGGDTAYPATAFLDEWMDPAPGGGWQAGELEQLFLSRMRQYLADGPGDATALVWLHSEYDSRDADLSASSLAQAMRVDAGLVRQVLGRDIPYLYVAAHPYGDGTDSGHQAIRQAMETLAADPGFNARIAARAPDLNVDLDNYDGNEATREYGGAHISASDALIVATRIARVAAEEFAAYAKPGSPVALAGGNIASDGPQVVAATRLEPTRLQVDVRHDGVAGFAALDADAAAGVGWSALLPNGTRVPATGAAILDADSLVVSFGQALPVGAVLDYAWGIGKLWGANGTGQGHSVADSAGLPVWTAAAGVVIGNAAPPPVAAPSPAPAPAPPVVAEPAPPVVAEPAPPVVAEPAPPVVAEPAPPVVAEPAPPVVAEPAPPVVAEPAPAPEPIPAPAPQPGTPAAIDTTTLLRDQATVTLLAPDLALVTTADGRSTTVGGSEIRFADGREVIGNGGNAALVDRLHDIVLGRDSSLLGTGWAADALDAGRIQARDLADGFLAQGGIGAIGDDRAFVTAAWTNAAGAPPTEGGVALLLERLEAGNRADFLVMVATEAYVIAAQPAPPSGTFVADWGMSFGAGLVRMAYGRDATLAELRALDAQLDGGWSPADVARALTATDEYQSRMTGLDEAGVATLLHQGALGRAPDAAELAEWNGLFANGATTTDLAAALADFWEFQAVVQTRAVDGVSVIA
ncbi:DUF4214 domain-containing protein [Falsiroseomonas stagni]|uniref:DUF4214 domain-containing protein n=1 Tax=Falsiroseomonas stagni DSM 19981 TaxID=1123062 RepID=A0A1I3XBA6_9PROT|nr:DUF4214 domain-containing protein [Falsiroseomonas stagni]SFK16619.1 protein of unknown function [Falsiroseomonas stagni DSM 19981]